MRNPEQCMPSVLKLVELNWTGRGWKPDDYAESLRILTDISFDSFTHPREVLARHPDTPQIVVDYRDITGQPREAVHAIYRAFGMELSPEYDASLGRQEQREKRHTTRFEYSIDDYDHLSVERIRAELADFYQEYGWGL
jgi:hypothetical protein